MAGLEAQKQVSRAPHSLAGVVTLYPASDLFSRWAPTLICLYALVAALSIAASQIIIVSTTLLWLVGSPKSTVLQQRERQVMMATLLFLAAAIVAALVGIQPQRAVVDVFKTGLAMLFPFVIAATVTPEKHSLSTSLRRVENYLFFFALGQLIAGVHSIGSAYLGKELPIGIPGPVTESGQLVLLLPMLIAVSLACYRLAQDADMEQTEPYFGDTLVFWSSAISVLCLSLMIPWPNLVPVDSQVLLQSISFSLLCGLVLFVLSRSLLKPDSEKLVLLRPLILGVLLAVMIINLKRGPWLGMLCSVGVLGALFSRRLIIASIGIATMALVLVEPVQQRLLAFAAHFSIAGGRQSMWQIGLELVQRFPLGIGLDNARFMRTIDPSLPYEHRHMHNNVLNIAVEVGFIGLISYVWWIVLLLTIAWQTQRYRATSPEHRRAAILTAACGAAILGWQISGTVEYNFGDGEVRMIAFSLVGIMLGISRHLTEKTTSSSTTSLGTTK